MKLDTFAKSSVTQAKLAELQKDARLTNLELSARVNLSPSPCLVRVRALERAGIIERHVTLLNARRWAWRQRLHQCQPRTPG